MAEEKKKDEEKKDEKKDDKKADKDPTTAGAQKHPARATTSALTPPSPPAPSW